VCARINGDIQRQLARGMHTHCVMDVIKSSFHDLVIAKVVSGTINKCDQPFFNDSDNKGYDVIYLSLTSIGQKVSL
jgi:hypothetical protein